MVEASIPKRLGKEPLIESLWEMRFTGSVVSVGDLLPGLLFSKFRSEFPKFEPLPVTQIPLEIRRQNRDFRYLPTIKLSGDQYSIQIGDNVVILSCQRPYTGWTAFGEKIRELVSALKGTGLVEKVERFSMKYIDILPVGGAPTFASLALSISIGEEGLSTHPIHLRTERHEGEFTHILQVISPAEVTFPNGDRLSGVLLDTDTVYECEDGDFWGTFDQKLDQMHKLNKEMFFKLLKPDTIKMLGPEY